MINHYYLKQSAVLFQNAAWAWKVLDAAREVSIGQESFLRLVSEENIDDVSETLDHLEETLYQNQKENKYLPGQNDFANRSGQNGFANRPGCRTIL